jgi:hypothetical protein
MRVADLRWTIIRQRNLEARDDPERLRRRNVDPLRQKDRFLDIVRNDAEQRVAPVRETEEEILQLGPSDGIERRERLV